MVKMNKEEFFNEVSKLGIDINEKQKEQLDKYCKFLIEYNTHTNLTAIKDEESIYLKHFYDSLTFIKAYKLSNEKVLDIGIGPGFPGMILKIVFPSINMTLLDSNNKKIKFLKELTNILDINNINIVENRAEDYIKNNRETFDIVTSRAVSDLKILSEISLPYVKINGYFIPLKGSNKEEIKDGLFAIEKLGGYIENIVNFTLPIENSDRNILLIKKVKKTSLEYPSQYSKIIKNPLKKEVK